MTGYRCHGCEEMVESEPYAVLQLEDTYRVFHTGCFDA